METRIPNRDSVLDRLEQVSKISSAIAVPLLVAFFGWQIQRELGQQNIRRDYVQLAVSILKDRGENSVDDEQLRKWAVDLLNANSTVRFGEGVAARLADGNLKLPNPSDEDATALFPVADRWLQLVDGGMYAQAWDQLWDHRISAKEDFVQLFLASRTPFGKVLRRSKVSSMRLSFPDGSPAVEIVYKTVFEDRIERKEVVMIGLTPVGYRVTGHWLPDEK